MPSTEHFESFREFVLQPLERMIYYSGGEINTFLNQLLERYEYIVGEARRNCEEYSLAESNCERFFKDMLGKASALKDSLFNESDESIIYRPSGRMLTQDLTPEDQYLTAIKENLKNAKALYESYIPETNMVFSRTTRIPSFSIKDPSVLNDAYSQLTSFGYVPDNEYNKKEFVDVFTGRVIKKPIRWLGSNGSLAYLIKGILSGENVNHIPNKEHWLVTQKCFLTKNGMVFDTEKLRTSDVPSDTSDLDNVISTFNKR